MFSIINVLNHPKISKLQLIIINNLKIFSETNPSELNENLLIEFQAKLPSELAEDAERGYQISFITSCKGSTQLCINDFPFTRHRVRDNTVYWRCVHFKALGFVRLSTFLYF